MTEAFQKANNVLLQACKGIADLITTPGLINLDFADVRTIMRDMGGKALMGSGTGQGENRAVIAAQNAINSPLLEEGTIEGSRGVLINISGGADLSLYEVNEACRARITKKRTRRRTSYSVRWLTRTWTTRFA